MKTFGKVFVFVVGIPGAVFAIPFFLGWNVDQRILDTVTETVRPLGLFILVGLVLVSGVIATHKVVNEDRERYEKDFYGVNTQARIEKAHLIFFHLYQEGQKAKKGIATHRDEWDKKIQRALRRYCNEAAISVYLCNTGRYNPGTDFHPLPEDNFDWALEFTWQLLSTNFENHFKVGN